MCELILTSVREMNDRASRLRAVDLNIDSCRTALEDCRALEEKYTEGISFEGLYTEMYSNLLDALYESKVQEIDEPEVHQPEEIDFVQEAEVNWDEFSVSGHSGDSGYAGSTYNLSEISERSSDSVEFQQSIDSHLSYVVDLEHIQVEAEVAVDPESWQRSYIVNWLAQTQSFAASRKRKLDEADDIDGSDAINFQAKRKEVLQAVRKNKSDTCIASKHVYCGLQSTSDMCLFGG